MRDASTTDRLRALRRTDKWFLACGDGIIWAPPFPNHLHRPGFWDEALVYYHPFAPLFTVVLITGDGDEVLLSHTGIEWEPSRLTIEWHNGSDVSLVEQRYGLPGGRLVCSWRRSDGRRWSDAPLGDAHLVALSIQPGETVDAVTSARSHIKWRRTLYDRHRAPLEVVATLFSRCHGSEVPARMAGLRSEGTESYAMWSRTPFWETWQAGLGVKQELKLEGMSNSGSIFIALDVATATIDANSIEFTIQLAPVISVRDGDREMPLVSSSEPSAPWIDFFESFPRFSCSDPYFERYYDYRIYGLGLNRLASGCGNVRYPAVAEGIGYFHVPISYSAQCHMFETRWSRDPSLARGSLLNFLEHQKPDGSLHGRIYTNHLENTDFYHANWGDAALAVHAAHPDERFIAIAYQGLGRYVNWLDNSRDRENSGMYDVLNQFETGQEYMSRYQVVDREADIRGWEGGMRLKGIDVTVYGYQLKRALAAMARVLDRAEDVEQWSTGADTIGSAITEIMWDPDIGMFSDVRVDTFDRTGVKAAVCFYPLLTDLLDDKMVERLIGHLRDPAEFATPYPVPSSSVDDPLFNANAEWKGKRHNCPWNGRTWPMVNSHVIEGLLRQWHRGRTEAGELAADLLSRFVRMMFLGGSIDLPNCYEHYNPFTGHPCVYRGIDDYQHSWVLDLILRCVFGLEPKLNGMLVNPLPLHTEEAALKNAHLQGRSLAASRTEQQVTITVDGMRYSTEVGQAIEIEYERP